MGAHWKLSDEKTASKLLTSVRDQYREAMIQHLRLGVVGTQESASELFRCFNQYFNEMLLYGFAIAPGEHVVVVDDNAQGWRSLQDWHDHHGKVTVRSYLFQDWLSIHRNEPLPFLEPERFITFEIQILHNMKYAEMKRKVCNWNLQFPLEIKDRTGTFKFLCCITYNGNHFKTHLLVDFVFHVGTKLLEHGMYVFDAMGQQPEGRREKGVPTTTLNDFLPNFDRDHFIPHLFIDRRVN